MNVKSFLIVGVVTLSSAMFSAGPVSAEDIAMPSFDSLDTNQDGYISGMEILGLSSVLDNWKKYDTDADGRLGLSEFNVFLPAETFIPVPNDEEPVFGAAPT